MSRAELAKAFLNSFRFARHDMAEVPANPAQCVGYVQFADSDTLKVARWKDGCWLTEKLEPFPADPVAWFSVEVGRGAS